MPKYRNLIVAALLFPLLHGLCPAQGRIAFYSDREGNIEIYVMNHDGTGPTRLTFDDGRDVCPDWSPDGKRVAFLSDRDGDYEIYVMDDTGGDLKKLTDNADYEVHPDWSPDGKRIAFVSDRGGNEEIYVMDADGANTQRLTSDPANDMRPDWSPDGKKILFNSYRDGNWEIYVMDSDGTHQERLTATSAWEIFPRWSPDGARITFMSMTPGSRGHIYVMNSDGTGKTQLTFHPEGEEDPVWSADGQDIVFQSTRDGNFELYRVPSSGGSVERLTTEPAGDLWPSCEVNWGRLEASVNAISASQGGQVDFTIEAGPDRAGCWYILLAGVNGTGPGIMLPGGSLMPVRWDRLTSFVKRNVNGPRFDRFRARLDGLGGSTARLKTLGPVDPLLSGLTVHFACAVMAPSWWAASNAIAIEITP